MVQFKAMPKQHGKELRIIIPPEIVKKEKLNTKNKVTIIIWSSEK